jgi:hypothetical protein
MNLRDSVRGIDVPPVPSPAVLSYATGRFVQVHSVSPGDLIDVREDEIVELNGRAGIR